MHDDGWCRDDINMVVVMRAMGVESDQEVMELIGSEPGVAALMASTVQEAKAAGIFTKQQALEYLGAPQNAFHSCLCPLHLLDPAQALVHSDTGLHYRMQTPPN